ncbi:unnamed protein product [Polarella glacialis]|uniref:Uncharacterized protein n=1 Tax=Polarella glacialis TaxID=89957 RepID=A0A813EB95_POLGL|nr:unnamed protein product [Polarella glacialis]
MVSGARRAGKSNLYPAWCKDSFPVNLGFCQEGSTVQYRAALGDHRMRYRNILVLFSTGLRSQGFVVDASSALVEALIPEMPLRRQTRRRAALTMKQASWAGFHGQSCEPSSIDGRPPR